MSKLPDQFDKFDIEQLSKPNALPEDIDFETHIVATYLARLHRRMDAFYMTQSLCIEQSTGTFTPVPAETPETRRKH